MKLCDVQLYHKTMFKNFDGTNFDCKDTSIKLSCMIEELLFFSAASKRCYIFKDDLTLIVFSSKRRRDTFLP